MKKLSSFYSGMLFASLAIFLSTICLISCKKNETFSSLTENYLNKEEKSKLVTWIIHEKNSVSDNSKKEIDSLLLKSDWDNAIKMATFKDRYSIFYVPILGRNSGLSFFFDEEKKQVDSGNIVTIYSKNGESKVKAIVAYYDQIVLHNVGKFYFSGSIAAYSFSNKLKYEYSFKNGQIESYSFAAPRNTKSLMVRTNAIQQKENTIYDCEWWGHFTIWTDGSKTLDYTYLVCTTSECQTTLIKTINGFQYIKTNCGGGGGEPYAIEPDPFGIDCASFIFEKTASNWQEAGIKNHRFNMVWMGGERHGLSIRVTIESPIIIGLPINRVDGTHYSEGRAAEIAAGIVQAATILTHQSLKNEPYRPTDSQIEAKFRVHLAEVALLYAGTVGRTGSSSTAIYINNDPRYKLFGNGDCD